MAEAGIIGALRVILGVDSASLESGLAQASTGVTKWSAGVKTSVAAAAASFVAFGAVVGASIVKAMHTADDIGKAAQKLGLTTEELSALRYAAALSDVSMESLSGAMTKLNKNIADVAGGDIGKVSKTFDTLKISVWNANGSVKNGSQVLSEIAGKFETFKDGANKSQIAATLMGKAVGVDMIPFLNTGAAAIEKMKKRAAELGLVLTDETFEAAQDFNDQMRDLKFIMEGLTFKVMAGSVQMLRTISALLVESAKSAGKTDTAFEILSGTIKVLAIGCIALGATLTALMNIMVGFGGAMVKVAKKDFTGAKEELVKGGEEAKAVLVQAGEMIKLVWKGVPLVVEKTNKNLKDTPPPVVDLTDALEKAKKALAAWNDQQLKSQLATKAEIEGVGKTAGEVARLKVLYDGMAEAEKNHQANNPEWIKNYNEKADAAKMLADQLEKTTETFQFLSRSMDTAAGSIVDVAMGAKTGKEAFKEFTTSVIRDIGMMITKFILLNAVVRPLFGALGGGGFASAFMGFGARDGASLSFASGGSFMIPGGSSMTDNHVMPINVASGERVTVDRPGDGSNAPTQAVLVVRNRTDRAFLESIAEGLNGLVADGYRLKVA